MNGIDVSVHNGYVDFTKVKAAGYDFVMVREGYGDVLSYPSQKDSRFETNYKAAKAAGLNIGAYHYLYATTAAGARREAQGFINNLKGKTPLSMPVALDMEERCQYNLPNTTVEAIVEAFMNVVEAAGYYCVLYSYESFLTAKMSATFRSKYDVWCANITRTPAIKYGIHQYSFTGRVNGISGAVDLNRTAVDYPTKIKNAGLNGYPKPSAPKTLDSTGFKKGDKGNGVLALKKLLMLSGASGLDSSGGFGGGTEKAVNALLKKWGYKQNGTAGDKFINKIFKELSK